MSGHSHAKKVMHQKGAADAKRSQVFSKLANELTIAAKEGGSDPTANPRLRTVIEKAKEANMPGDNVERAIKKAVALEDGQLEEMLLEGYGPGGIAILISCITDNRNRTLGDIKQILTKHQGKLVEGGAVRWLFDWKGIIVSSFSDPGDTSQAKKDELELMVIESGAEDFSWNDASLEIYIVPASLEQVSQNLKQKGISVESTTVGWIPKEGVAVSQDDRAKADALFEALDENSDVQEIYSNLL